MDKSKSTGGTALVAVSSTTATTTVPKVNSNGPQLNKDLLNKTNLLSSKSLLNKDLLNLPPTLPDKKLPKSSTSSTTSSSTNSISTSSTAVVGPQQPPQNWDLRKRAVLEEARRKKKRLKRAASGGGLRGGQPKPPKESINNNLSSGSSNYDDSSEDYDEEDEDDDVQLISDDDIIIEKDYSSTTIPSSTLSSSSTSMKAIVINSVPVSLLASSSSAPPPTPTTSNSVSRNHSADVMTVLQDFYLNQTPYPTKDDFEYLERKTGLEYKRILYYFSNRRRREHVAKPTPGRRKKEEMGSGGLTSSSSMTTAATTTSATTTTVTTTISSPIIVGGLLKTSIATTTAAAPTGPAIVIPSTISTVATMPSATPIFAKKSVVPPVATPPPPVSTTLQLQTQQPPLSLSSSTFIKTSLPSTTAATTSLAPTSLPTAPDFSALIPAQAVIIPQTTLNSSGAPSSSMSLLTTVTSSGPSLSKSTPITLPKIPELPANVVLPQVPVSLPSGGLAPISSSGGAVFIPPPPPTQTLLQHQVLLSPTTGVVSTGPVALSPPVSIPGLLTPTSLSPVVTTTLPSSSSMKSIVASSSTTSSLLASASIVVTTPSAVTPPVSAASPSAAGSSALAVNNRSRSSYMGRSEEAKKRDLEAARRNKDVRIGLIKKKSPHFQTLVEFFAENPYPKEEDFQHLASVTGIERKSIFYWFSNRRRRLNIAPKRKPIGPAKAKLNNNNTPSSTSTTSSTAPSAKASTSTASSMSTSIKTVLSNPPPMTSAFSLPLTSTSILTSAAPTTVITSVPTLATQPPPQLINPDGSQATIIEDGDTMVQLTLPVISVTNASTIPIVSQGGIITGGGPSGPNSSIIMSAPSPGGTLTSSSLPQPQGQQQPLTITLPNNPNISFSLPTVPLSSATLLPGSVSLPTVPVSSILSAIDASSGPTSSSGSAVTTLTSAGTLVNDPSVIPIDIQPIPVEVTSLQSTSAVKAEPVFPVDIFNGCALPAGSTIATQQPGGGLIPAGTTDLNGGAVNVIVTQVDDFTDFGGQQQLQGQQHLLQTFYDPTTGQQIQLSSQPALAPGQQLQMASLTGQQTSPLREADEMQLLQALLNDPDPFLTFSDGQGGLVQGTATTMLNEQGTIVIQEGAPVGQVITQGGQAVVATSAAGGSFVGADGLKIHPQMIQLDLTDPGQNLLTHQKLEDNNNPTDCTTTGSSQQQEVVGVVGGDGKLERWQSAMALDLNQQQQGSSLARGKS